MFEGIITVLTVGVVATANVNMVATKITNLPNRPDPSALTCHDAEWERTHLLPVGGTAVDAKLTPFVQRAMSEAATKNLNLTITSGYRNCDQQRALRIQACGTGDYNILSRPIDQCRPPTESPGKSMHNEGLAIDFGCSGYTLFQNSPCYPWLKQNASRYHLYEHALEQWHWSTTGK